MQYDHQSTRRKISADSAERNVSDFSKKFRTPQKNQQHYRCSYVQVVTDGWMNQLGIDIIWSSVVRLLRQRADQDQVRVDNPRCIKLGYSEPIRAQNRGWSSKEVESYRVNLDVVILSSESLTKFYGFRVHFWLADEGLWISSSILIGCRQFSGSGQK